MPRLEGNGVLLREYRSEDFPAIASWVNDPEVTRYLSSRYWLPQTETDTREYLSARMASSHSAYYFVIASPEDNRYLGQIDLYMVDWRLRCATLGMVVLPRGKGVGTAALRALSRFAFDTLGLERLEAEACAENAAALRCYEKAGFSREGVKRHGYYYGGAFRDVVMMSLLREDAPQ